MTRPLVKTLVSFVDKDLTAYCEEVTSDEPPLCRIIREHARDHLKTHWTSGPLIGTFLEVLVSLVKARRVLEVGTFFGYSAVYMATGRPDVEVVSLEINSGLASQAQQLIRDSPLANRVFVENVDVHTWFRANPEQEFDVIFFDSNRDDLMRLYDPLLRAVKVGGVLVMDNACLRRKVLEPKRPWEFETVAFNASIQRERSFITTLLPVRDGILLAHRITKSV